MVEGTKGSRGCVEEVNTVVRKGIQGAIGFPSWNMASQAKVESLHAFRDMLLCLEVGGWIGSIQNTEATQPRLHDD